MELEEFRKQIDEIDRKLIELLKDRFAVTQKVGQYKAANGITARDPNREAAQFAKFEKLAQDAGLNPDLIQNIMRQIIDEVVASHKKIKA